VPRAGGQNDHVAGPRSHHDAVIATELHGDLAAIHAERFVRVAMEVMKGIDAIAPSGRPTMAGEQFLERWRRLSALEGDRLRIHE